MAAGDGNTTKIDKGFLNEFRTYVQGLVNQLKQQVMVSHTSTDPRGSGTTPPVDANLVVAPGTQSFGVGTVLNQKLKAVGGSVATQLAWLEKLLGDIDYEIGNTVTSFTDNETLNNDTVDQFLSKFPNTVNDLNGPGGNAPGTTTPTTNPPTGSAG